MSLNNVVSEYSGQVCEEQHIEQIFSTGYKVNILGGRAACV
jgi:hypothetical protein